MIRSIRRVNVNGLCIVTDSHTQILQILLHLRKQNIVQIQKIIFFSSSKATWHNKDFVMPIWCLPSDWFRANFCFIQLSRPQVPHLQDWLWQKGKRDLPRFKLLIGQLTQILRPDWSKPRIRPSMMTILPLTTQSSCWNETGPKLEPLHRTSQYKFLFIGLRIEPENSFNQWIVPPHHRSQISNHHAWWGNSDRNG